MLTLYRARLSRHWLCLIMLPEVETFALILLVVTAGAVDVVVDVAADAFTTPRFFNEPIEPFNKSGLSTSGPPNSCSCCNQQHSIASIPSSTCEHTRININNHIINSITIHVSITTFSAPTKQNRRTCTSILSRCPFTFCIPTHTEKKGGFIHHFSRLLFTPLNSLTRLYSFIHFSCFTIHTFTTRWINSERARGEKGRLKLDSDAFS